MKYLVGFDPKVFDLNLRDDELVSMEEFAVEDDFAQVVEGAYQAFVEKFGEIWLKKPGAHLLQLWVRVRRNPLIR